MHHKISFKAFGKEEKMYVIPDIAGIGEKWCSEWYTSEGAGRPQLFFLRCGGAAVTGVAHSDSFCDGIFVACSVTLILFCALLPEK